MNKVFVVNDGGCPGVGCCNEIVGVFSSIYRIKEAFPEHEYVPTGGNVGYLVRNGEGYFVDYNVQSFEMDGVK